MKRTLAIDREKILQAAQKLVDKKKFDKAIQEYQKIIQQDPNDARTLLKIGDLQARMEAYAEAIATYDRVGQFYSAQGFSLKAIAVYKQIRELIKKHVPQLEDRYGHIVPKLAAIYAELGLTSDALAAYDEVATRLQRNGRDRDAIDVFRKMVALDSTNPLPHLRLAEACCRVQSVDEAIDSFWTAAELLIQLRRRDDALKVVERILHFRQETRYARVAAELYLERNSPGDGMQALAKLQLCFQADPKNLEVLDLLARAFISIGQAPKALEVKKEIARLAEEQGRDDVFRDVLAYLQRVAPDDEQVLALARGPMSQRPGPNSASGSFVDGDDVELIESSVHPSVRPQRRSAPPSEPAMSVGPDLEVEDYDFDEAPLSARSLSGPPEVAVEEIETRASMRPYMPSMPEVVVVDEQLEAAEEVGGADSADARAHARKAVIDAESFRGLRLYSKAIETLRIALEIDPGSVEIRKKLRDVLSEAGDRDGAIGEMIALAAIYIERGETHHAEAELYQVLEAEPGHAAACEMLEQLGGFAEPGAEGYAPYTDDTFDTTTAEVAEPELIREPYDPEAPLPSYDLEGMSAASAIPPDEELDESALEQVDDPFAGVRRRSPLPSFPLRGDEGLSEYADVPDSSYATAEVDPVLASTSAARRSSIPGPMTSEGIEEILEEAEFFTSRGLTEDARSILVDALARSPNHPLLVERLRELDGHSTESGTHERTPVEELPGDDRAFDIAASLDALDELEHVTASSRPPASLRAVDEVDVDQVFAKFKEGVRAQVSESDSSTHYDLGVAYKEMALLPDAINEFSIAARDPRLECTCQAMIGMIHLEQGDLDQAAEAYIRALGAQQKTIDQEMSLYYDLGTVYEMKSSNAEALYYFQKIARRDPGYRDVRERIEALTPSQEAQKAPAGQRAIQSDDELEAAFDDLFESK
ncbi:MAG TPA: tetratricopeptide repeat protein [Polyangiaceae bacterium]|nr:tetratricopeptide repeat protein [Polyangiaceae bacterium]